MKRILSSTLIGAVLALSACSSDDNKTPPLLGAFRAVNGVTDSTKLGVRLNDVAMFNDLAFGDSSGLTNPPIGNYPVRLAITTASSSDDLTVDNISIDHNRITTIFTAGSVGGHTDSGFAASQSIVAPAGGQFAVQPVHAAYNESLTAPTLGFFFAPVSGDTSGLTPLSAGFRASETTAALTPGTYRIIVKNGGITVFDSGTTGIALPPAGANVLQIAALDAPGSPNGSPISLLIVDNVGGQTEVLDGAP